MSLEEYKQKALARLNETIVNSKEEQINYACMGVIEETGEIIAEFRKPLFKGNFHEKELEIQNIKKELGDLIWYLALICKNYEIDMNKFETKEIEMDELPKREKLIKLSLQLGACSGKIVEETINGNKEGIEKSVKEEFEYIYEIGEKLNITIDEILNKNINKINNRYDEIGNVKIKNKRRKGNEYEKGI